MIVANSGPLIALGKLGLLDLLQRLYGPVYLASAVHREVVGPGSGYPDAVLVQLAIRRGQLVVVDIEDTQLPPDIAALPLDMGEKHTLCLALREKAALVLVDELTAREEMQARGLIVKGTLGIVVDAHRSGLLSLEQVESTIETIIARRDIWIAEPFCRQVLAGLKDEREEQ
ncbi:MAG: hypothetical protein FJ279_11435 [Planctomycetes bacterium]|nr:hypothetical protein [Planctomycetota bacterium]